MGDSNGLPPWNTSFSGGFDIESRFPKEFNYIINKPLKLILHTLDGAEKIVPHEGLSHPLQYRTVYYLKTVLINSGDFIQESTRCTRLYEFLVRDQKGFHYIEKVEEKIEQKEIIEDKIKKFIRKFEL